MPESIVSKTEWLHDVVAALHADSIAWGDPRISLDVHNIMDYISSIVFELSSTLHFPCADPTLNMENPG